MKKEKNTYFVMAVVLIAVYFVAKGLFSYWDNVAQHNMTSTLDSVCYDLNGDTYYSNYVQTNDRGKEVEMSKFTCYFER